MTASSVTFQCIPADLQNLIAEYAEIHPNCHQVRNDLGIPSKSEREKGMSSADMSKHLHASIVLSSSYHAMDRILKRLGEEGGPETKEAIKEIKRLFSDCGKSLSSLHSNPSRVITKEGVINSLKKARAVLSSKKLKAFRDKFCSKEMIGVANQRCSDAEFFMDILLADRERLKQYIEKLIEDDHLEFAEIAAHLIPADFYYRVEDNGHASESVQGRLLIDICSDYTGRGELEEAERVAFSIPDKAMFLSSEMIYKFRDEAIEDVIEAYDKRNMLGDVVRVAKKIPPDAERCISVCFQNVDAKIEKEPLREFFLLKAVIAYIKINKLQAAIGLARSIDGDKTMNEYFEGDNRKVLVKEWYFRDCAYAQIKNAYIKKEKWALARAFVDLMRNVERKPHLLKEIDKQESHTNLQKEYGIWV